MGRPSSLTAERRETIEAALASGVPLSVAAASVGVSERTVNRWLEDGLVARRRLVAVPEPGGDSADLPGEGTIERAVIGSILKAAKTDWRAAAWLAERRWPRKYRLR
jgi:hypothetical protein